MKRIVSFLIAALFFISMPGCTGGGTRSSETEKIIATGTTASADGNGETPDQGNITSSDDTSGTVQPPETEAPESSVYPSFDDIIGTEIEWTYADDPKILASIDGNDWTAPDYDDSAWMTGKGSFGSNDGQLKKLGGDLLPNICLRQYLPDGKNIPVYYFRLAFTVSGSIEELPVTAGVQYDDSVVIYLNGEEVFAGNAPEDGYSPEGYGAEKTLGEPAYDVLTFDASDLRDGVNVLAVELHQDNDDSSDIYFALESLSYGMSEDDALRNDTLCLCVGSDPSELLVTWQGVSGDVDACVRVDKKSAGGFTDTSETFEAEAVYEDTEDGTCTYRATITGLEPGEYIYRAEDESPTEAKSFTVPELDDSFTFIACGDPQISDEDDPRPMEVFEALADYIMNVKTPSFILSLGDQSDSSSRSGPYRRFVSTGILKTVPIAPIVGNHEKNSERFSHFFYMPNMDENSVTDAGDMSGDYWFYYCNTLFLCLDSNNKHMSQHEAFLRAARAECIEKYGEPTFTVAAYHHSIFSAGDHADDDTVIERREKYPPLLAAAGVDVVFSGHDHTYTRSYLMDRSTPIKGGTSRDGIVYFTLGSSTGTKYYDLFDENADYAAFTYGEHTPSMARIDVKGGTMTVTTYIQGDDGYEVLDSYTLSK